MSKKLTDSTVKALIGTAASTFAGRNLIKLVPFIGWATSAVVAAGVTEAIGWTIAVDFAKSHQKRCENKYYKSKILRRNLQQNLIQQIQIRTRQLKKQMIRVWGMMLKIF